MLTSVCTLSIQAAALNPQPGRNWTFICHGCPQTQHQGYLVRYLLVSHVCRTGDLAGSRSHTAPCAIGRSVIMEIETMRKGGFMEEISSQVILKI